MLTEIAEEERIRTVGEEETGVIPSRQEHSSKGIIRGWKGEGSGNREQTRVWDQIMGGLTFKYRPPSPRAGVKGSHFRFLGMLF